MPGRDLLMCTWSAQNEKWDIQYYASIGLYPESVGFVRSAANAYCVSTLENGFLRLTTRPMANEQITYLHGNPMPSKKHTIEVKSRIISGHYAEGLSVWGSAVVIDILGAKTFQMYVTYSGKVVLYSNLESGGYVIGNIDSTVFYVLRAEYDGQNFGIWIDGNLILSGDINDYLMPVCTMARVGFRNFSSVVDVEYVKMKVE